jgi:hypothetical protein
MTMILPCPVLVVTSETHTITRKGKAAKGQQAIWKNAKHVQEDVKKGSDDDREMMVNPTLEFHPRETNNTPHARVSPPRDKHAPSPLGQSEVGSSEQ